MPTVGENAGYTKLYGNGAIYCISFVSEEIANIIARQLRAVPVSTSNDRRDASRPQYAQTSRAL